MREAIALAKEGMDNDFGGPFGAVIVKGSDIVGRGYNRVTSGNDPTAHGEVVAIRDATKNLGTPWLEGCDLYTSCEPCPMCLGATMWAHINRLFYAGTEHDAAEIGFDDANFYQQMGFDFSKVQIEKEQLLHGEARKVMLEWLSKMDKQHY